jgi:hypothetical protein
MNDKKTTMIDIMEAAGGAVSDDRTKVSGPPHPMEPFDIVVRVVPLAHEFSLEEPEMITFGLILNDEYTVYNGRVLYSSEFNETIRMPVSQVCILNPLTTEYKEWPEFIRVAFKGSRDGWTDGEVAFDRRFPTIEKYAERFFPAVKLSDD